MKKIIFNRGMFFGVCIASVAFLLLAIAATAQQSDEKSDDEQAVENLFWNRQREHISISPVQIFGGGTVIPSAGSMLVRKRESVFFSFYTANLTPGTVVTAWLVVFNNPNHCATRPCSPADFSNPAVKSSLLNTGGHIIGADGAADYGAFRAVGDTTGALFGPGLLDTRRAEIHLVTRTHGAASSDPTVLQQQLTTFNGGCPPNTCANLQASIHQP